MSILSEIPGNIFTSQSQTLVNTVNCRGVMGAGIALEFKIRLPEMFKEYSAHCKSGRIQIGKLWLYKPIPTDYENRWVLNFPTKDDWRKPSKIEYLKAGLEKFVETYKSKGITSIAFPVLGANNGRLDEEVALEVMRQYLGKCVIPVEIYRYDPEAEDDLFEDYKRRILEDFYLAEMRPAQSSNRQIIETLKEQNDIKSFSQLASVRGIRSAMIEKSFRNVMRGRYAKQPTLIP